MSVRNIRVTVAYDGTDFCGWQIQKSDRTVQGEFQDALGRMHGHEVKCTAAGRTDSGVHASGQVVNFRSDLGSIRPDQFREAVNSYLPDDIRVLDSEEVPDDFSARRSARWRVYRYYVYQSPVELPHRRRYCLRVKRRLDVSLLDRMARLLVGEHDFTAFAAAGDANASKVRRIVTSCVYADGSFLVYKVAANSFLWKMVRSIVGSLLELEERTAKPEELADILRSADRSRTGKTAAGRGLFLEKVYYDGYPI